MTNTKIWLQNMTSVDIQLLNMIGCFPKCFFQTLPRLAQKQIENDYFENIIRNMTTTKIWLEIWLQQKYD